MVKLRRRRLLLDMDGVITNFFKLLFDRYHARYGVRYRVEDLKTHELEKMVGPVVYAQMAEIFNEPGFFAALEPYEGALGEVAALSKEFDIFIATSPTTWKDPKTGRRGINPHCVVDKFSWISENLPDFTRKMIVTKDKSLISGDALADDSDHNIGPWAEAHPAGLAVVIEQPWNASYELPKNAVRATLSSLGGVLLLAQGG